MCTCNVTLLVGGAAGTTTNCMANTNSTIIFRVMDLNQQFNALVTLNNARLSATSEIALSKLFLYKLSGLHFILVCR